MSKNRVAIMTRSIILFTIIAFANEFRAEVTLVEDHKARCAVVTGENDGLSKRHFKNKRMRTTIVVPSRQLEEAAEDLAEYLDEIGWIPDDGQTVNVVKTAAEAKTPCRILLGTAAIKEHNLQEEAKSLSWSGYIYRTMGDDLLIFGSTSKGTANGVYGFLQDELGVRWFGPQELFTVVPRKERIAVGPLDKRVEPSFTGSFGVGYGEAVNAWKRRMRLATRHDSHTRVGIEPFSASSHHVHHVLPVEKHFNAHPEYFTMRNGKRWRHPNPHQQNLCWSNPEAIDLAAAATKKHFGKGPQYHTFSIAITDADAFCECDKCVKFQPERRFRGRSATLKPVASDMYFHFVNEVAKKVKEDFPDRYLGLIAYNDVSAPPAGSVEPNVFVQICLDVSEHFDVSVAKLDEGLVRAWEDKNITLGLYYYTGLAKLVPAYFPHRLAEVLRNLHKRGVRGLHAEVNPGWPWTGPMVYADARLWWDVNLDVDKLLDEYFEKLYGPAASHVKALYERFEEIHMRPRQGGFLYEHYNFAQFNPYTAEDLREIRNLLATAHQAVEKLGTDRHGAANPEGRRLAYLSNGLRLFLDMLEGVVLARELESEDDKWDDVGALETIEKLERVTDLLERHERIYRESIMLDPTQSHRYTVDTCVPVRARWKEYLERVIGEALVRLHNATRTDAESSAVRDRLVTAAGIYCDSSSTGEARYKLGIDEWKLEGPNLVSNSSFEESAGKHLSYPPELEWKPAQADMWESWGGLNGDEFGVSNDMKFSGNRSARITGDGGTLIGVAPNVVPGELYYFEVHVNNATEPEDGVGTSVGLRWLDRDNHWLPGRFELKSKSFKEWERLDAVAEAPKNAASAVVLVSARNVPDGAGVHVDDVTFSKIAVSDKKSLPKSK